MKETIAILVVAVAVMLALSVYLTKVEKAVQVPDIQPTVQPAAEPMTQPTIQPIREGAIKLVRAEVQEVLKDISMVLDGAFVSLNNSEGVRQGYRVVRILEDSPLVKLGIEPDDVVTHLNGNELTSPELLFLKLSQIDNISTIAIDIIRNNEKKTLFVEIQ